MTGILFTEEMEQKHKKEQEEMFITTKKQIESAKKEIEDSARQEGDRLEREVIPILKQYIKCLRGEEQDWTGFGLKRILFDKIENICKVTIKNKFKE